MDFLASGFVTSAKSITYSVSFPLAPVRRRFPIADNKKMEDYTGEYFFQKYIFFLASYVFCAIIRTVLNGVGL